ncbi:ectoine hydrolase DoeA [Amylibacter ulvae]|uniref:Ectoine hydrolase DoeA n=1 Tax=Paramylibacter ulvae TaxID=1651968 RepID=A0ABQ3D2E7_9RHOB|nr:M24 family metallopeptidase [Amylibacter ulvae]GHA53973.1 ectoine hydrolase DoeA [Amylibacter ulvae]
MPDVELPFTRHEYQARLNAVRAEMAARGIEVLFTCDPSNMAWLTGYDGWSFYVHQGVIIGPTGDPIFWGRAMDAVGASKTCYMAMDDIIGYPDHFVMSTERHAMKHLGQTISDRGWGDLTLGVELENYYYSAKAHMVLSQAHSAQIMDATALINWQRAVKSETELTYMNRAARIVEKMHARVFEIFEPGKRKNEVAAEIYHTGIWGAEDSDGIFGGDYAAICPLLPTGEEAAAAHLTWNDKPIPNNSGTFFELAGCYKRYHVPLSRTIWLGEPPKDVTHAEQVVLEGIEAGISAAVAGNTTGDVARAFYTVLNKYGVERDGRCGYPIGLSYPPDWGERTYSIRPEDDTVLQPNMTFHFMPALWMPDWGLEITETLRICETGAAQPLADVPRKLFVKK